MSAQGSPTTPQNAGASSMYYTSHHQPPPSQLRAKVVEILSRTANGCLQELNYHPGMPQKLNELARSAEDTKNRNIRLYEDNHKLALAIKRLSEKFALNDRFHKAKIQTLEQQVEALHRQHQETLKREQNLAAGQPDYSRLHSEYIRVVTICKNLQQEVSSLQKLLLEKSTPPTTPNTGSSSAGGNASMRIAPLQRNSMNIPAPQQQPHQHNSNVTHPNQQVRQMVNQPQPGPSQLPRQPQVPSQRHSHPQLPSNSSQMQTQLSTRVHIQNPGYIHGNIQAPRPSVNYRSGNIPNDVIQIENTQVRGASHIQNQANSPNSQGPMIHGWSGNAGYPSGPGTNRHLTQIPMNNMVNGSPHQSPNQGQGQTSGHNPRIPGSTALTTATNTNAHNMNMNRNNPSVFVPSSAPYHHQVSTPPQVMNQHVQYINPTLPPGSTLFAIGSSGELLSPLMGAISSLPSAPPHTQHRSTSSTSSPEDSNSNLNSRHPSRSNSSLGLVTENANAPSLSSAASATSHDQVQTQTRERQTEMHMQIDNHESPSASVVIGPNSPVPIVPPSPSVHSCVSTPTPGLTPGSTTFEQEDNGGGLGLKRASVDNGSEENARKKVKLDVPNSDITDPATATSTATTTMTNVPKDNVEAQVQTQAETKNEEKEKMAHEEDEEEEEGGEDEIGPDGLRTIKACLEAFVDDDENEVPTCQLCLARHESGLIDKPTTFKNGTEQEMVNHFLDQHPSSWESLRYCKEQ